MIQIGILGCGRVVQNRYVEVFQNELSGVKVAAVCDQVKKKADHISSLLGCRAVYNEKDFKFDCYVMFALNGMLNRL